MNLMLAVCVSALSSVNEIMNDREKKAARAQRAESAGHKTGVGPLGNKRLTPTSASASPREKVMEMLPFSGEELKKGVMANAPIIRLDSPLHGSEEEQLKIVRESSHLQSES